MGQLGWDRLIGIGRPAGFCGCEFVLGKTGRIFRTASSDRPGLFCCWFVNADLGLSRAVLGLSSFGNANGFWNVEAAHNHEHNHGFSEYCAAVGTERRFDSRTSVRGAQKVVLYVRNPPDQVPGTREPAKKGRGGASGHKPARVSQHPTINVSSSLTVTPALTAAVRQQRWDGWWG